MSAQNVVKKEHICNYCSKKFSVNKLLERHIRSVHNKEKHFCMKCDKVYSCPDNLRRHLKLIHKSSNAEISTLLNSSQNDSMKKVQCSMCNKKFRNKRNLNRHLKNCNESESIFNEDKPRTSKMDVNIKMKSNNYKKSLKRAIMVTQVKIKKEAVEHVEEDNTGKNKCNDCGKEFKYKSNLYLHMRKVQCKNKDKPRCEQCDSLFQTPQILKEHISSNHSGLKVICKNCGRIFSSKANLWRHVNKARCKYADKDIPSQSKTPAKEVSKESKSPPRNTKPKTPKPDDRCPFTCEKCPYKSDTDFNLKRHTINRHFELLFTCNYCKFHSFEEYELENHCIGTHEEQIKVKISKQKKDGNDNRLTESEFYCDLCSFETREENTLTNHLALEHYNDIVGK